MTAFLPPKSTRHLEMSEAGTVAQLRAEIERLRTALRYISQLDDDGEAPGLARAALEKKP